MMQFGIFWVSSSRAPIPKKYFRNEERSNVVPRGTQVAIVGYKHLHGLIFSQTLNLMEC